MGRMIRHRRGARWVLLAAAAALAAHAPLAGQTDYYNTDAGRPLRIEDAAAVERHAFELQLAPVRLERAGGGRYTWEVEPEIAYGILPRTQVEVGFPFALADGDGGGGLAGIHLSALHTLNTESSTLPSFAVAASAALPVGSLAADETYATVKGIATRTGSAARVHLNAEYTFGPEAQGVEAARWMAGLAIDRALPLRALLLTAGAFAEQPLAEDDGVRWTAEAGFRYQLSPQFGIDAGIGRVIAGPDQAWYATFGTAYAFAVRSLIPIRR
jgi:hypothetical protein